jgi:bifunctional non-homologous end joining protein LigD
METQSLPSVALFCQLGGSDKEYHLSIEAKGDGFVVNFANGRRGGALRAGTKTTSPVALDAANKIYAKVLKEKLGGGYTVGEGKAAFAGTDMEARVSGLLPQLLNEVDRAEMERLILNDDFGFQEKMDGNRVMIRKTGSRVEAVNRKGLFIAFPKDVETEMLLIPGDVTLDGEVIGQVFHAFDCLYFSRDLTSLGFKARYMQAEGAVSAIKCAKAVVLVPAAFDSAAKRALFDAVLARNGEGVVAKQNFASYAAGRPAKGGDQLKFKFRSTATVIVAKVNDQRSVLMAVLDSKGAEIPVGNVTIPPNKDIPAVGDLVEVVYLYAFKGGSLFQPTFDAVRTDLDRADASIDQLKYKAE